MRMCRPITSVALVVLLGSLAGARTGRDEWNTPLQAAIEGATALRVRSGGTCHRDREAEVILVEVESAEAVRRFARLIEIDPQQSGFRCMCCGDPTIEIYRGEALVLSLGYHHGQSLRWLDRWQGDGRLTAESAARIAEWMSTHGVEGPARMLVEAKARDAAAALRVARQLALFPNDLRAELADVQDDAEAAAEVILARGAEGVRICFAVLGCHRGAWDGMDQFEEFLLDSVLGEADEALLAAALGGLEPRTAEAHGAARYVFSGHQVIDRLDRDAVDAAVPALCSEALRDSPALNRRMTLAALGKLGTPNALTVLRRVLGDGMPALEPEDPAGRDFPRRILRTEDARLTGAASDLTIAAEAAAAAGDRQSLALVERFLQECPEADRERAAAAAATLRNP